MFRFSLVSTVCLVLAGQAHASWADGLFEELTRDFGAVPRGQVVTHPFRVVNNTGGNVVIRGVTVSCGRCSAARALQTSLAPGQETAILVSMMTNQFSGPKTITVLVQFSQPRFEEVRIWVQSNSRDDVAFSSEYLNFGTVKRGKEAEGNLNVTFYGNPSIQVLEAKCDSNYVLPSVEEVRREGAEVVYRVSAKLRPDTPPGKWFSDIWLKTNNASLAKLRVPVTVEVEVPVSAPVTLVSLGKIKAGEETDRKVILRGVQPFRILGVTGSDQQMQVRPVSDESKTMHVLTVTLFATEVGDLIRHIRIQTDLKSGPEIGFSAQAEIVP